MKILNLCLTAQPSGLQKGKGFEIFGFPKNAIEFL